MFRSIKTRGVRATGCSKAIKQLVLFFCLQFMVTALRCSTSEATSDVESSKENLLDHSGVSFRASRRIAHLGRRPIDDQVFERRNREQLRERQRHASFSFPSSLPSSSSSSAPRHRASVFETMQVKETGKTREPFESGNRMTGRTREAFESTEMTPSSSSSGSLPSTVPFQNHPGRISSTHLCTGGNQNWSGAKLQDEPHKYGFPSTTGNAQFRVCYLENVCWEGGVIHYYEGEDDSDGEGQSTRSFRQKSMDSQSNYKRDADSFGLRSLAADGGGLVKLGYIGPLWTPQIHKGYLPAGASFFSEQDEQREPRRSKDDEESSSTKTTARWRRDGDLIHTLFEFSWEDNIGHYLFDNLLPTWIALDAFGLTDEWRSVVPTAYSDCARLGGLNSPYKGSPKRKRNSEEGDESDDHKDSGLLTRQRACLVLVSSMTEAFFEHPLLVLPQRFPDEKAAAQNATTTCFRRVLVGQNSAFSIQSLKLDLGGHVRRLRDHALRLHPSSRFNKSRREKIVKRLDTGSGDEPGFTSVSIPMSFSAPKLSSEASSSLFPAAAVVRKKPTKSSSAGGLQTGAPAVLHIVVAERGVGFTEGAWDNVCQTVQEFVRQQQQQRRQQQHFQLERQETTILVSCITPSSMTLSEELRWMQEADIFVSEDGTTSLAVMWSRDLTVSIVLGRGDGESSPLWKEDQHLLYMTHVVPLFVRLADVNGLGAALAHAVKVRTKKLSRSSFRRREFRPS
jgi:hypothetical protein